MQRVGTGQCRHLGGKGASKKKFYSAVQPRGGTVQVPWCGVLKSNVKMPSCSLHLWEATPWQVQSPREKSTKLVLWYHPNMKMPRSQLLLIVLLLAPLASAITLQTDLIEGSFKIKVKKKSEKHYFYHIKSIKDVQLDKTKSHRITYWLRFRLGVPWNS